MQNIKPTKKQLEFLDWEFGAFFHFGIRTFYEGHRDWDMEAMPLNGFNPKNLNCEQWIETIKEAGAKYAILVCKHHDGFANWPSAYTENCIKNTPYKNGNGDVTREFVDACRKFDIKVGLYYSPADFGMKEGDRSTIEHDDYFINQITELLSNYGKIDYLWFDGCGSEGHDYDKPRIIKTIRSLQEDILIFNMWDPDTRWVGNEGGFAPSPNFNLTDSLDFSVLATEQEKIECAKWLPAECDFKIREENWFYSDHDEDSMKTLDEIIGIYYYSVGRGANFLINFGPNRDGLIPEKDVKRILEFGNELKRRFECPIACIDDFTQNEDIYTYNLPETTFINHVILQENLDDIERIEKFEIYVSPINVREEFLVYSGSTIGHKAICQFPTINANKVVIKITKSKDTPILDDIKLYYVK